MSNCIFNQRSIAIETIFEFFSRLTIKYKIDKTDIREIEDIIHAVEDYSYGWFNRLIRFFRC